MFLSAAWTGVLGVLWLNASEIMACGEKSVIVPVHTVYTRGGWSRFLRNANLGRVRHM